MSVASTRPSGPAQVNRLGSACQVACVGALPRSGARPITAWKPLRWDTRCTTSLRLWVEPATATREGHLPDVEDDAVVVEARGPVGEAGDIAGVGAHGCLSGRSPSGGVAQAGLGCRAGEVGRHEPLSRVNRYPRPARWRPWGGRPTDLAAALTRQGRVVEVIASNLVGLSLPLVQEGLTFTLATSHGRLALLDGAQRAGQDELEVARAMVQPFLAAPDAPQEPHDGTEPQSR